MHQNYDTSSFFHFVIAAESGLLFAYISILCLSQIDGSCVYMVESARKMCLEDNTSAVLDVAQIVIIKNWEYEETVFAFCSDAGRIQCL